MKVLHLCNTRFEWELTQSNKVPIEELLNKSPSNVLQFLPYLYASHQDAFVTTHPTLPSSLPLLSHAPRLLSLDDIDFSQYDHLESWGASKNVAIWAQEKGIHYPHPSMSVTKEVNSKAFSFTNTPQLPNAQLLYNEDEAANWIQKQSGPLVFKTCFGAAGGGHLIQHSPDLASASTFLKREWQQGHPVVAEPWVKRLLDFSTYWMIAQDKHIQYLGTTLLINDAKGRYRQNKAGEPKALFNSSLPFLEKQRMLSFDILKKIADLGYFGNVGIDAMLYEVANEPLLHPVVEINARKTMGWVALTLQQHHFPLEILTLSFSPKSGFTINCEKR